MSTGWLTATAFAAPPSHAAAHIKHLCAHTTTPGHVACLAEARTDIVQHLTVSPDATPSGYGPSDLQSAYNLPSSTAGSGRTVAIVDAMDDPNAESDLAAYRSQYGLPACTTANGCFHKVNQTGGTTYPSPDSGWAGEISLDLDMVSAVCPQCHITLVEASSTSMTDIGTAENEAVALGAKYVSNSFGGTEDPTETTADVQYFNHPGVAVTVSAGDSGYGVEYPASSPYVTAVGGTSLSRTSNTRGWSESVWSNDATDGTGSGCSADEAKPTWQTDTGCTRRTVADVSAVADPNTGVAVYDTYGASGWDVYGGTSASSPIIAATYALAGTPTANSYPSSYPYGHTAALNDVSTGSDGTCSPAYLCTAGTGYDGPTGLGTPNGTAAFAPGATSVNSLQPGQKLTSGHKLSSGNITLTMGSDGNLVAYLKTNGTSGSGPAIWSTGTSGHSGAYAYMQTDGNLVVYSSTGTALWSTHTNGHSGAYFLVQDDGNLVVYGSGGGPSTGGSLWSDGTYVHSATIGSGQKLKGGWWAQAKYTRLVMQPDGNLVMYRKRDGKAIWSTGTSGHSGAYAYMQTDGNLVVYSSTGTALWSTHTNGHSGAYAVMQNDGNFVVYTSTGGTGKGGALWASNTRSYVP
jgi:subtilase family serine protease